MDAIRSTGGKTFDLTPEVCSTRTNVLLHRWVKQLNDRFSAGGKDATSSTARSRQGLISVLDGGHARLRQADSLVDASLALLENGAFAALGTIAELTAARAPLERYMRQGEKLVSR